MSLSFKTRQIPGFGRGKGLGCPTLNLDLRGVPGKLLEGVYAVRANGEPAVMHFGPRLTFDGSRSCEVHLLTGQSHIPNVKRIAVEVIQRLRDVRKFENEEALKARIAKDIQEARAMFRC